MVMMLLSISSCSTSVLSLWRVSKAVTSVSSSLTFSWASVISSATSVRRFSASAISARMSYSLRSWPLAVASAFSSATSVWRSSCSRIWTSRSYTRRFWLETSATESKPPLIVTVRSS